MWFSRRGRHALYYPPSLRTCVFEVAYIYIWAEEEAEEEAEMELVEVVEVVGADEAEEADVVVVEAEVVEVEGAGEAEDSQTTHAQFDSATYQRGYVSQKYGMVRPRGAERAKEKS